MIGIIEIYSDFGTPEEKLLFKEENMIVDGASEILADIFTITPSLSGISSASGILDASNYTIKSITFGKDALAFSSNGHGSDSFTVSGRQSFTPPRLYLNNKNNASAYITINGLPNYPDPLDRKLENMPSSVSAVLVKYGHNMNVIPYFNRVSELSTLTTSDAFALGCFPQASGSNITLFFNGVSTVTSSVSSTYNLLSSMDYRGFVRHFAGINSISGLITSSTSSLSSTGQVNYLHTIQKGDMCYVDGFGGIFTLGLWGIDLKQSLANGNVPPYVFNVLTNPMTYKLFSKRSFTTDLSFITNFTVRPQIQDYKLLTIVWKLLFI